MPRCSPFCHPERSRVDLRFYGLLETRTHKGEMDVFQEGSVDDKWRWRTGSSGAHKWRTADPLGSPGFPVKSCGFGQLHVVLFRENHISGGGESCEVGNPGTLGMTKRRGPWQRKGGCWMQGQLLSRGIVSIQFGQQTIYMQPEVYSAKRASKQSTSYILKKPVAPLIWTTLKFSRPCGTEFGNGVLTRLKAVLFKRFRAGQDS